MQESIAADPSPQPPIEPDAADCCGEGCPRCVFDVYDDAMARYRIALAAWQTRQSSRAGTDDIAAVPPAPPVTRR